MATEKRKVIPSLKLTAGLHLKNRVKPKWKGSYSNHPFSGANLLLVLGRLFMAGFSFI